MAVIERTHGSNDRQNFRLPSPVFSTEPLDTSQMNAERPDRGTSA
jgi:hypothetical protein